MFSRMLNQLLLTSGLHGIIFKLIFLRCPPCQKLKPKLHDAAHNNGGKWVLAIVNVDLPEVKELSSKYAVLFLFLYQ